jgi:hypothetical protein
MGVVWLISGAQGSGKSTIADLLARTYERGVHVRGGQFYRWAVTGWVHPFGPDPEEATRLLDLRYRLSALAADQYAAAGFTAVVQDNIYGNDVPRWLSRAGEHEKHLVVLRPDISVVAARDDARRRATGKVAYHDGFTPAMNDELVASVPRELGLWIDTSRQEPEHSLAEMIARSSEAHVG